MENRWAEYHPILSARCDWLPKWDVHSFFITVDDAERETGGPVLIIYPALEYRYDGQPVGWRKAQEAAIISRLCRH